MMDLSDQWAKVRHLQTQSVYCENWGTSYLVVTDRPTCRNIVFIEHRDAIGLPRGSHRGFGPAGRAGTS